MARTTEVTVSGGGRYTVDGDVAEVEQTILAAARGSILELAWLTDSETGERLGVNPAFVVALRAAG